MNDKYTVGQAGAVGPNSRAEQISFAQTWQQQQSEFDVEVLATELNTLRTYLRQQAESPEEDGAVAEVGRAREAALIGNGPQALEHLRGAGKWALSGATAIGTAVAAAALKAALGI